MAMKLREYFAGFTGSCLKIFDRLQVNYLSTALLSMLMLPHLLKTGTPESASRLVIVSSEAHYLADTLKGADKWDGIIEKLNDQAYCTSR
jgi:NAD(P)-dependent dehydrogenase (short-subunit alcohol dehydrogenase family)